MNLHGNVLIVALAGLLTPSLFGQHVADSLFSHADSDDDGLSDALEEALLKQFAPTFMVAVNDCSNEPAEFWPDSVTPMVMAEDGAIYGQVSAMKNAGGRVLEIHYYHLWRQDCGRRGHALDAEHVAVQVRTSDNDLADAKWKAMYWYAAAHEDTVCDVSQIARASTLRAEDHGAKVWISRGKHASYLNEALCTGGCGGDECDQMRELGKSRIVNLGEIGHPMNGSMFASSKRWPLTEKMKISNFPEGVLARLNEMPETEIAWFNSGRHPAQGVIAVSGSTEDALARSGANTTGAISVAGDSTGGALSTAVGSTGSALGKSYRKTTHALTESSKRVGSALGITDKEKKTAPPQP